VTPPPGTGPVLALAALSVLFLLAWIAQALLDRRRRVPTVPEAARAAARTLARPARAAAARGRRTWWRATAYRPHRRRRRTARHRAQFTTSPVRLRGDR
jgi:hypothetical protein